MSSLTNINNNSSVVNVGRTTPVSPGPQPASRSIPVVVASDQSPIPVIEQQKIQSEVALSMLGIPRGEVALGIFSDVNTYDVNPTEWSSEPAEYTPGWGIKHLPQEAGAIVQAPKDKLAILTSKRFFRYQPGRVSAATFGVKSSNSAAPDGVGGTYDLNPSIRKYGIFDKLDGYYWETRGDSTGDNFAVVRRTQSLLNNNPVAFSYNTTNQDDYRVVGKPAADTAEEPNEEPRAIEIIRDQMFNIADDAFDAAVASFSANTASQDHLLNNEDKCKRDAMFALNAYILDLQYGGTGHTLVNATTYRTAIGPKLVDNGSNNANAKRTAENQLHEELGTALKSALSSISTLNGVARNTRINALVNITRATVGDGATLGLQPGEYAVPIDLAAENSTIWARNKTETVFAIYKRYLGYLISEAFTPGSGFATAYANIEYKCLRDVGYIVDGYMRDLVGGGNAATVYNMKNFYFNNVLRVTSEFASGYSVQTFHIHAHTILKALISKDGNINSAASPTGDNPSTSRWNLTNLNGWTPVFNLFGLGSLRNRFNTELADPLIANFTTQYEGRMDFGTKAQFGDLVVLRDGLIHVHAAVYDPSLLKPTKKVRVRVNTDANTLEVAEGEFVVDQIINFIGEGGSGTLVSDKFYAVKTVSGPLSNIITLYDPEDETKAEININAAHTNSFINPNVPFVFPNIYQKGRTVGPTTFRYESGMFPYMYTVDGVLPRQGSANYVGYIDTAQNTSTLDGENTLRAQIDDVNYLYNNWIKQNVDPKYYAVYEYRVPRSRFSTDKLDGETKKVVYSDIATENGSKVRPGQNVVEDGAVVQKTSVWDIDLTKVTMLKVEFSWYGAVGALFLAYVPVSNDEARWVRVHHLRASNQLKVSSLGNATLPITYVTYGGGSVNKLGIIDDADKGYGQPSNHIVKYGASYYIDGGDRGTVRLYSHNSMIPTTVYGKIHSATITSRDDDVPSITINSAVTDKTYFMKAQIQTTNIQDQNVKVVWVDGNTLYLNKKLAFSGTSINIIANRPAISFGLKAKEDIFNSEGTGIRNRVQVYPTKLSTANFESSPITLDVLKSPIFQPNIETANTFVLDTPYTVTPEVEALDTSTTSYLAEDGDFVYGWFRANVGTVFGRLYRDNGGSYYFELKDVFTEEVIIDPAFSFLKDGRFAFDGTAVTGEYEVTSQKERLSSVFISNVNQTPIPETGNVITSFFLTPGSNQYDLLSYFDYNKDYLSFPLTNAIESIYLAGSIYASSSTSGLINTSITWEEQ